MFREIALCLTLFSAAALFASEPVRKPEEYPSQTRLGRYTIAADNLGPSVPSSSGGIYIQDYLTIEVAIFTASADKRMQLSHADFGLRINGSKALLRPDSAGFVAAAIKYPDWEQRTQGSVYAGSGSGTIILGRQQPVGRFPGDRRPTQGQPPNPVPRVDSPAHQKGEATPVEEVVEQAALPQGEVVLPMAGCLYFRYKGKLKKIKTLELVYAGPLGEASVRIP